MRRSFMAQVSKGAIPRLEEFVQMHFSDLVNIIALMAAETLDKSELQRIQP